MKGSKDQEGQAGPGQASVLGWREVAGKLQPGPT